MHWGMINTSSGSNSLLVVSSWFHKVMAFQNHCEIFSGVLLLSSAAWCFDLFLPRFYHTVVGGVPSPQDIGRAPVAFFCRMMWRKFAEKGESWSVQSLWFSYMLNSSKFIVGTKRLLHVMASNTALGRHGRHWWFGISVSALWMAWTSGWVHWLRLWVFRFGDQVMKPKNVKSKKCKEHSLAVSSLSGVFCAWLGEMMLIWSSGPNAFQQVSLFVLTVWVGRVSNGEFPMGVRSTVWSGQGSGNLSGIQHGGVPTGETCV